LLIEDVTAWLRDRGLEVDRAELDGRVHRVPMTAGKRGKKNAWYIGWQAPVTTCVAGDWASSRKWTWSPHRARSPDERRAMKARSKEAAKLAETARRTEQECVALEIRTVLAQASAASPSHPYLAAKGIEPCGALMRRDTLLIPNQDVYGNIWGAQRISPRGGKLWFAGQRTAETFFQVGELTGTAYLCEGFATAVSIHKATGSVAFATFSAGNFKRTGAALLKAHPDLEWVVAGDDDYSTANNPGARAAEATAKALGAPCILPRFADQAKRGTDFNDLALAEGLEAVQRQLQGAQRPMAPVINIAETRRERDGTEMSQTEFFQVLVQKMNRHGAAPADWPTFPRRFHVVSDDAGRKAVLEELAGEIVVYRDEDVVADAIIQYAWNSIPFVEAASGVDYEKAVKCRNMWLGLTPPLPRRPDALLERSQPGLTFKRLSFDAPPGWPGKPPPVFEEFISRCSQPLAFCAFIGSLFYPQADRQQYLYLYGEGGDGKGALMRLLRNVFGAAAVPLSPPTPGDKFWNMRIYGKRLGLFFDCADWKWFASPQFKSLTGNDPLFFEEKNRSGFSDLSDCKIIAASNSKPVITSQKSDLRRLIFIGVRPVSVESDPTYEARLTAEAEAIIRSCKEIYLQECPTHGPIPFDPAVDVALESEAAYLDVFNAHFIVDPEAEIGGEDVRPYLVNANIRSTLEVKKLKDCWGRQIPGLEIKHGKRGTRYVGIRPKHDSEKIRERKKPGE
jgi:putative DNA primase/helicase